METLPDDERGSAPFEPQRETGDDGRETKDGERRTGDGDGRKNGDSIPRESHRSPAERVRWEEEEQSNASKHSRLLLQPRMRSP